MFHKELWQYGQRRTGAAFFAQPHAVEVCRRGGAWGARSGGKISPTRLHSPMPGYHFRRYSKGVMPSDFLKTLMKYPAFWKPQLWAMDSTEPSLNRSMDLAWEMRLAVRSSDRVEPMSCGIPVKDGIC